MKKIGESKGTDEQYEKTSTQSGEYLTEFAIENNLRRRIYVF